MAATHHSSLSRKFCTEFEKCRRGALLIAIVGIGLTGNICNSQETFKIPYPTLSKEATVLTEPLDDDGFVDYIAVLNGEAAEGVTPENNFEVVVREVMGDRNLEGIAEAYYHLLGVTQSPNPEAKFISLDDFLQEKFPNPQQERERQEQIETFSKLWDKPWSGEEFPLFEELLKRNERALEIVVEGSKRTRNFSPLVSPENAPQELRLMAARLPSMNERRAIVQIFLLRATRKLNGGDPEGSWADLETIHRIARLTTQTKSQIEWLAGIGFDSSALKSELIVLRHASFNSTRLRELAAALESLTPFRDPESVVDQYERYQYLEAMTKCYCLPERLKSLTNRSPAAKAQTHRLLKTSVLDKQLKWGNRQFDELVKICRIKDSVKRTEASDQFTQVFEGSLKKRKENAFFEYITVSSADSWGLTVRNLVYTQTVPSLLFVGASQRQATRKGMTTLAFLLEAYRSDRGEYPENLSQLVPEYVEKLPLDECSGKPFHFTKVGKGCLLVSFGLNQRDESVTVKPDDSLPNPTGDDIAIELQSTSR